MEALKAGYAVRAAVRNEAKANLISAAPSIKELNPGDKLTFANVPDIVAPNAYTEAVKGVSGIVHIASPMMSGTNPEEWEDKIIKTAVAATTNVLDAAEKETSVKRMVITSSLFATIPWRAFGGHSTEIWGTKPTALPTARPFQSEFEAYAASKVYALHATADWVAQHKPHFDVVNMLPSFVLGRNELVTSTASFGNTNAIVMGMALGADGFTMAGATVHVDDVAWAQVRAVEETIPAGTYVLNAEWEKGTTFEDAHGIIAKAFPQAVERETLKNNGKKATIPLKFDASETEEVFGLHFKGYEEQVKSIVGHWLELYEKEQN